MPRLAEWVNNKDRLNELGFTDTEIEDAIVAAVTDQNAEHKRKHPEDNYEVSPLDWLTEKEVIENKSLEGFIKWQQPNEILRQHVHGSITVSIPTAPADVHYHAWKNIVGTEVRIKGRHQSTKHSAILHRLLSAKFPWFDDFKWAVYGWESRDNTEIYLKVTHRPDNERGKSLYVPVIALMESNPDAIVWRNRDYAQKYYGTSSYSLNANGRTPEQFEIDKKQNIADALEVLDAPETLRLFDILKGKK